MKIFYLYNVKIEGAGAHDPGVVKIEKVKKFTIVDIKILSPLIKTHYFVVFANIKSYFSQISS